MLDKLSSIHSNSSGGITRPEEFQAATEQSRRLFAFLPQGKPSSGSEHTKHRQGPAHSRSARGCRLNRIRLPSLLQAVALQGNFQPASVGFFY